MTLPKTASPRPFFQGKKAESLILPALVIFILVGVIAAAILIPKKNKEDEERKKQLAAYTQPQEIKVHEGKTLTVAPVVEEVTAEELRTFMDTDQEVVVVQIYSGEGWQDPHIKGALLIQAAELDHGPSLSKEKYNVFVSSDGLEGAISAAKVIASGYPREKNVNLKGGLAAWKAKGYELEN